MHDVINSTLRVIRDPLICRLASDSLSPSWTLEQLETCRASTVLRVNKIEHANYRLTVEITGRDSNTTTTSFTANDVRLVVNTHSETFSVIEMVALLVLSLTTFSFFLYWTAIYFVARSAGLLPEQR